MAELEDVCTRCPFRDDCDVKGDLKRCPIAWACQCAQEAEEAMMG